MTIFVVTHGDSKVPPYSVKARLGLMRSALAGVHCDQREGSTLLRKRNPRRRWSGRVGRCHSTQCRGLGTRPAARNHPRTYNTHATGNHPSSLIVGRAQLPSGLRLTIPQTSMCYNKDQCVLQQRPVCVYRKCHQCETFAQAAVVKRMRACRSRRCTRSALFHSVWGGSFTHTTRMATRRSPSPHAGNHTTSSVHGRVQHCGEAEASVCATGLPY